MKPPMTEGRLPLAARSGQAQIWRSSHGRWTRAASSCVAASIRSRARRGWRRPAPCCSSGMPALRCGRLSHRISTGRQIRSTAGPRGSSSPSRKCSAPARSTPSARRIGRSSAGRSAPRRFTRPRSACSSTPNTGCGMPGAQGCSSPTGCRLRRGAPRQARAKAALKDRASTRVRSAPSAVGAMTCPPAQRTWQARQRVAAPLAVTPAAPARRGRPGAIRRRRSAST